MTYRTKGVILTSEPELIWEVLKPSQLEHDIQNYYVNLYEYDVFN